MEQGEPSIEYLRSLIEKPDNMTRWEYISHTVALADAQSILVAIVLTVISWIGVFINCAVMFAIWRARLLQRDDPLYILSTFAMVDPTIRLLYCGAVWSPSDVFRFSLISKDVSDIISISSMAFFYQTSAVQLLIAFNRYCLVTNNPLIAIFTRKFYVIYCSCSIPGCLTLYACIYYIFGCCKMTYDTDRFCLHFEPPPPGHVDIISNYIFLPMCILCSIAPFLCYLRIFFITRKKVHDPSVRTLEFGLIFIIYICFWAGLKFHTLLPATTPRCVNALVMVFGIMDATSISLVQATFNKRIKSSVMSMLAMNKVSQVISSISKSKSESVIIGSSMKP